MRPRSLLHSPHLLNPSILSLRGTHLMRLRSIIAGLLGLTLGTWMVAGHADAYRWTDSNGVVHFSQTPPNDRSTSQVRDTPIGTVSSSAQSAPSDSSAPAPSAPTDKTKSSTPAAPPPASQKACDTARSNLSALSTGQRVRVMMPDGKVHWMDPSERQKRLKETKDFLSQRCK